MADLQRKTANLFDKDNLSMRYFGYINNTTYRVTPLASSSLSIIVPVKPNSNYTISKLATTRFRVGLFTNYPVDGSIATAIYGDRDGNGFDYGTTLSFFTSTDTTYIMAFIRNYNDTVTVEEIIQSVMVNEGSTALPYEPYWQHSLRKLMTATDTLTALPVDIYADGNNATVGLEGNMSQTDTPTPDNPIMPQGTGERTGNLWDGVIGLDNTKISNYNGETEEDQNYALSDYIPVSESTSYVYSFMHKQSEPNRRSFSVSFYNINKELAERIILQDINEEGLITIPFTTTADTAYIRINWKKPYDDMLMLSLGSTAKPYEPWGIKISISSASTTTPVYFSEVQTTRRIKKYEFTGQETIYSVMETLDTQGLYCFIYRYDSLGMTDIIYNDSYMAAIPYPSFVSSHFINKSSDKRANFKNISVGEIGGNSVTSGVQNSFLVMCVSGITSEAGFKQWLAAQYAAGTPVTVWYVLGSETTGIVNEPLMKIGDYADEVSGITIPVTAGGDTISVGTTVQPSEVTANYHGWHNGTVHECESGQWDE